MHDGCHGVWSEPYCALRLTLYNKASIVFTIQAPHIPHVDLVAPEQVMTTVITAMAIAIAPKPATFPHTEYISVSVMIISAKSRGFRA